MNKKHLLLAALCLLLAAPQNAGAANQTTEGTDFWFTLMQADADDPTELSLTISAKTACTVTISNPYTGYSRTINMTAGGLDSVMLRKTDCYVGRPQNETVSNRAIHVTSTADISLFAGNWRSKSFDVANLLPTAALQDEYVVACYTPFDHEKKYQGTHFAIVAVEDNTVVDFVTTAQTDSMYYYQTTKGFYDGGQVGDTVHTPVLNRGQVYYVWTGEAYGPDYDFTGTYIKARNGKPIAVFNGNPHTNIPPAPSDPDLVRDRDHIYSQAMPTVYWGTKFPITASKTTIGDDFTTAVDRKKDKVRVLAYYDGTEVYVNGTKVHTFDFSTNPHHFYEFELGTASGTTADPLNPSMLVVEGTSCFVETSCPAAVHLFMVSNRYDYPKKPYCNGDPAMIWINPIEQVISEITFGTFRDYSHFTNVVTETANVNSMTLDGSSIASNFTALNGNSNYSYARIPITSGTHTLKGDAGFIAHVYGTGEKESYGYSAGGSTKPLEQYVQINGQIFTPNSKNVLCGIDTIRFSVDLNYPTDSIVWRFGDGTPSDTGAVVYHKYGADNVYHAQVQIYFTATDLCGGMTTLPTDPIDIEVNTQILDMQVPVQAPQCVEQTHTATINFEAATGLTPDSAYIIFPDEMKQMGFRDAAVRHQDYIEFTTPDTSGVFNATLYFTTDNCGSDTVDFSFALSYPSNSVAQRWGDVLFLRNKDANPKGYDLEGGTYQWYRNRQPIDGATGTYICEPLTVGDVYYVEVTKDGLMLPTCEFDNIVAYEGSDEVTVENVFLHPTDRAVVSTTAAAEAELVNATGLRLMSGRLAAGRNDLEVPARQGIYILKVTTDSGRLHTFKLIVK